MTTHDIKVNKLIYNDIMVIHLPIGCKGKQAKSLIKKLQKQHKEKNGQRDIFRTTTRTPNQRQLQIQFI